MSARADLISLLKGGGPAAPAEVSAVLGVPVPHKFHRLDGPTTSTSVWVGLCIWIHEHLARSPAPVVNDGDPDFVQAYYGDLAARAVAEFGPREGEPGGKGASTPAPVKAAVEDPLARAIIAVVPPAVLARDWRSWDVGFREAVGLVFGAPASTIPAPRWDAAYWCALEHATASGGADG